MAIVSPAITQVGARPPEASGIHSNVRWANAGGMVLNDRNSAGPSGLSIEMASAASGSAAEGFTSSTCNTTTWSGSSSIGSLTRRSDFCASEKAALRTGSSAAMLLAKTGSSTSNWRPIPAQCEP